MEAETETGNASKCKKQSSKNITVGKEGNPKSKKTINNDAPLRRSVVSEEDIMSTVSSKKLLHVDATKTNNVEGSRIIDISILCNIMGLFSCPEYQQNGSAFIEEDMLKRKGLASLYLMVKL